MRKALNFLFFVFLFFTFLNGYSNTEDEDDGFFNIKNDDFWNTKDEMPIYSQGGGVFKFYDTKINSEKYYWYGVKYKEAELYRNNPTVNHQTCTFESVTCYSSDDLVNWTFEKDVLTRKEANRYEPVRWMGRLGVAYIKQWNKYAMFVQHNSYVLIALSDSPVGEFTCHRRISMKDIIGTTNTGDQTVFIDEDTGKSYLVYSYGRGRNKIYISEIGVKDGVVDLLDCTQIYAGAGREGNCMFKYKGKYYMCASNLYGWDSSFVYYLVSDNIKGPYLPVNDMKIMKGCEQDYAHVSQTGFFYTIRGSKQETVIFCGDRWADFAGNGIGYNQWCPLSFEGDIPIFNSLSSWSLNTITGKWEQAKDNNFVKNGSFEADRRYVPSAFKPVQDHLLGWTTDIIKGNRIIVGDSISPKLNYFNSKEDRRFVIGEKSLNISDKVDFKRQVFQEIVSTPYVKLSDGYYTLSAKIRNSNGFSALEMYAISKGKTFKIRINEENSSWKKIEISQVEVADGKIEIGFHADGIANSFCLIDDVSLIYESLF